MGIFLPRQLIQEAYFGKTRELIQMEATLDEFRRPHLGEYGKVKNTSINSDPILCKFNRQMEDFFNFGCFSLIINNQIQCNACTMPIDYQYDYNANDSGLADTRTFKFKKEKKYTVACIIYSGIIFNPEFTTEEVMAIIMHEIGHNFNSAINKSNAAMTSALVQFDLTLQVINCLYLNPFSLIQIATNNQTFQTWYRETEKKLRANGSGWITFYDSIMQISAICENFRIHIMDLIRVMTGGLAYPLLVILNTGTTIIKSLHDPIGFLVKLFSGNVAKRSEKSADNFATMYGYGPALSSALNKLEGREGANAEAVIRTLDYVPVIGTVVHTVEFPGYVIASLFDEHPAGVKRIKDQLALLKRELASSDLDPKMRRQIEKDVKECEAALNKMTKAEDGISDPYLARKAYNKFLNQLTNSSWFDDHADQEKRFAAYDDALKH